jgi:hypothetical protein
MRRLFREAPYPHPTHRGVRDLHVDYNLTRVEVRQNGLWFATIYGLPGRVEPLDFSAKTERALENRVCSEIRGHGLDPMYQVNWHWLPGEEDFDDSE